MNITEIALANKRYIKKYYYDTELSVWNLILDYKLEDTISTWTMCRVATEDGAQTAPLFTIQTDVNASKFADRTFNVVNNISDSTEKEWFDCLVYNFNSTHNLQTNADLLYEAYLERRRYCCSYDALVRIGLRKSTGFVNTTIKQHVNIKLTTLEKLKALFSC